MSGFRKVDLDLNFLVFTPDGPLTWSLSSCASKDMTENITEILKTSHATDISEIYMNAPSSWAPAAKRIKGRAISRTIGVKFPAGLLVGKNSVGFLKLLEFLFCLGIPRIDIRMIFPS